MVRNQIHVLTRKTDIRYIGRLKDDEEINITEKTHLIKIILAYSAIKINAKPSLPYSILNPETSSDSPSAKSNGVRFVSATHEISQIPIIGANNNTLFHKVFIFPFNARDIVIDTTR